ncbi:FUSC family protein [Acetobacter estunensis]|uniref:FUSC family protein n=2 Tax=Acetobacter estunensis TaxID=104097 RepID=A0A967EJ42_9PROT|nr:FUSC family protein [Acetobacter estunensis]
MPRFKGGFFPPGWFMFCMRTWMAVVIALFAAFWLQISSPGSAAVTVMILAQPLRGQMLSKALYRLAGTFVGAFVALFLVSCFSQDRAMLLGGVALWLSLCCIMGTLERDFRAYAAMLAGYTVALIAIGCIDAPETAYDVTVNRVSAIIIGIAATAAVNDVFGSPTAWARLCAGLDTVSEMVARIARDAVAGHSVPDAAACAGIAGQIMALTSQVSFARTEIADGHLRMTGVRSAMVAMLEMLNCSRAIAMALERGLISDEVVQRARKAFGAGTADTPKEAVEDLEQLARETHKDAAGNDTRLTLEEAWFVERTMALLSYWRWTQDGLDCVHNGGHARTQAPEMRIVAHQDIILALLNGLRVLIGFSMTAGLCILSGLPQSFSALSQTAIVLTLAATTYNVRAFGMGALIGLPLAIITAAILNFGILPHGSDMVFYSVMVLPVIFGGCLLLLNPKTAAVGFNAGVFFFVILGVANEQSYDPVVFINRDEQYLFAGILIFISLTLLMPPSARTRRFRVAMAIGHDLRRQFEGHGEQAGSALISRHYDRLTKVRLWNSYLAANKARDRVFARLASLDDMGAALARARRHLERAATIPEVRAEAEAALRASIVYNVNSAVSRMSLHGRRLLELSINLPHGEMATVLGAVSGMAGAIRLLEQNRSAIELYDLLPVPKMQWRAL